MKKKIVLIAMILAICLSIAIPAYATEQSIRLVDNAELLDHSEVSELLNELDEISQKHQVDIVIVTTDDVGYKTSEQYADDYFDYNIYGYGNNHDGILLLINMEDNEWHISTSGYGETAITDDALEHIGDKIKPDISNGNYAKAFRAYIQLCDEMITCARDGHPYQAPLNILLTLLISLGIGLVVALIVTGIMWGQLKSIRSKSNATDYVKEGSLNISDARDMFLYRSITRRPIPQNNNSSGSHRSSSGRSHGGGGGRF